MPKVHFKTEGSGDNRYILVTFIDDNSKSYPITITKGWLDKEVDETQDIVELKYA